MHTMIEQLHGEFELAKLQPKTESAIIGKQLSNMLDYEEYIEPESKEEFSFALAMRNIPQTSMDDLQAWAFYHACKGDEDKALSYFKRSIGFQDPEFLTNYLYYLIQLKEFDMCEDALNKALMKYPSGVSALSKIGLYLSVLSGDLDRISSSFRNLIKLKNDESDKYEDLESHYVKFMDNMNFKSLDLKVIGDIYKAICKKYDFLVYPLIEFEVYPDYDIRSMVFNLKSEKYADMIPSLNSELAHEIAKLDQFDGKVFSISFDIHSS